jgi:hypothetical protein
MNWERDDQGRPTRPIYVVYEDALHPPRWLWWLLAVVAVVLVVWQGEVRWCNMTPIEPMTKQKKSPRLRGLCRI